MLPVDGGTDACDQKNVLHWKRVDPPWMLPNYVGELAQALEDKKVWIATGGVATSTIVVPDGPVPSDPASVGKSEVGASAEELLTPQKVLSKVQQADDIKHMFDKSVWVATPAKCQGWQIFVQVSTLCLLSHFRLNSPNRVSWWNAILDANAARCSVTNAMGWLTRFVGSVSGTRRLVRMWLLRVSFLIDCFA